MIDIGSGTPIVIIPGIQGRWEWVRPAVEALAERCRVVSFSLCDERSSGFPWDPDRGFENYVSQVATAMDRAGLDRAIMAGVSYGGLVAAEFAARYPQRVSGLVLISALPVGWTPDARTRFFLRAPRLFSPLFCLTAPRRLAPEVAAALPALGERLRFKLANGWRVVSAPLSPSRMARRVRWAETHPFADSRLVTAPTLVMTGEPHLDRVVPADVARRTAWQVPAVQRVVLPRTGHIGLVTRPAAFAGMVAGFVDGLRSPADLHQSPPERAWAS